MAEPMITKVTQQISATPTQIQNKAQAKAEPSKFDHVRSKLDKPLGTQQSHIPPEVIRIPAEQAYSASLSCLHVPGTKMSPADREACAEIARKHVKLARPKRLLLLGDGPAQALLGKTVAQARGHAHKIQGVRTVATFHPRFLIQNPARKAEAWKDLLLLMEDEA